MYNISKHYIMGEDLLIRIGGVSQSGEVFMDKGHDTSDLYAFSRTINTKYELDRPKSI